MPEPAHMRLYGADNIPNKLLSDHALQFCPLLVSEMLCLVSKLVKGLWPRIDTGGQESAFSAEPPDLPCTEELVSHGIDRLLGAWSRADTSNIFDTNLAHIRIDGQFISVRKVALSTKWHP